MSSLILLVAEGRLLYVVPTIALDDLLLEFISREECVSGASESRDFLAFFLR